jgi:hypothetical protein
MKRQESTPWLEFKWIQDKWSSADGMESVERSHSAVCGIQNQLQRRAQGEEVD